MTSPETLDTETQTPEHIPTETIGAVNPNTVLLITGGVVHICEDDPSVLEEDVTFLVTTDLIRKLLPGTSIDDRAGVSFAYYLEASKTLGMMRHEAVEEVSEVEASKYQLNLYTKAALSLFSVYLRMPNNTIARRMVSLAAASLYQVVTAHQARVEDTPIAEVLSDLSDLALMTQTVKDYVKGKKRKANYPYISFLKTILEQATSTYDLSFLRTSLETRDVIAQVKSCNKVITVC